MIASGHLDVRMPIAGRNDELDKIATTVNAMIRDIERVVAQVKNVTDTIAHDLRTPLTRVRSLLEEARCSSDLPPQFADMVDELVGNLDVVLERFTALLRISELEASERRSGFVNVRIAGLINDIWELYDPLAEEVGVELIKTDIDVLAETYADPNLLFEALSNLVDNAIKFARQTVCISVVRENGMTVVRIEDDGLGIPVEERDAVLRRFYRRSGDRGKPGIGLGLTVVTAILHVHRFKLDLDDAKPGLIACISMPYNN
jgi:signal transduction histidine kinase